MAGANVFSDEAVEEIRHVVRAEANRIRNTLGPRGRWGGRVLNISVAKTTIAHDKGATETIDLYAGTTKGSETTTGISPDAYNRFADLETGKWCVAIFIGGGWELIAGEC